MPLPPSLRRWLAANRRLKWVARIGGAAHSIGAAYENIDYDVNHNGEARVLGVLEREARPRIIFDVGANIGEWSLIACRSCPGAVIHAFEPIPSTRQSLVRNCSEQPRVRCHPFGLGETTGDAEFFYSEGRNDLASAISGVHGADLNTSSARLPIVSGDEVCRREGISDIDLLKIDVEGWEPQVLRGFGRLLSQRRIRVIQFEYNIVNIRTRFLLRDFYEMLVPCGYVLGKIYPTYVDFRDYSYAHEDFKGPNYLAVRSAEASLIAALGH